MAWPRIVLWAEAPFRKAPVLSSLVATAIWWIGAAAKDRMTSDQNFPWWLFGIGVGGSSLVVAFLVRSLRVATAKLAETEKERDQWKKDAADAVGSLNNVPALLAEVTAERDKFRTMAARFQSLHNDRETESIRDLVVQLDAAWTPRFDVDGYLEPTGPWASDEWRLHIWFEFSHLRPDVPERKRWERIKYTVNVVGTDVAVKEQEDDFEVARNGTNYRYTVVHNVAATIGARAASMAGHLMNPLVVVTLHVAKTPYGLIEDARREFPVRVMNASPETVAWATKNDVIQP